MTFQPFLNPQEIQLLQEEERKSHKNPKRTPEQIEAIYTNGQNVLVSASAGSGKTFVMVERILDKLKRGVSLEQLFISTFTVKAAGELKERIERRILEELAQVTDQDMRQHLSNQLSVLDLADIGTMDAFTQGLVVTYGYTLGLTPSFRILQDQNEQDLLKDEVFEDLFSDYMNGTSRTLFLALVKNFTGTSKTSDPFKDLVYQIHRFSQSTSHPKKWLVETFLLGYEKWIHIESLPDSILTDLREVVAQTADDLEDLTNLEGYKQQTAKGQLTAAYKKHQQLFTELRTLLSEPVEDVTAWFSQIANLLPSGADVTVSGVKYPVYKDLKARLLDLQHLGTILNYQEQTLPILSLLQAFVLDFSDQYLQKKMQEAAYEFTDISHFAIQILEENPAIRSLYQTKYNEVMVDEYQDNNHIQERMLDLLSNGKNRFMVGDVKQSIYRFRQADPQIFQDKFETYQKDPDAGKLILLKENFRSQIEVLEATNAIFSRLMDKEIGQIVYDETHMLVAGSDRQKIYQQNRQMEYLIYDTDASDEDLETSLGEVELVAKEIIRLVNEEQVPFSAITLLVPFRTRNQAILSVFEKHGIPLVSDGGEKNYLQSLEVMVMLDTLRVVNNPLNDYALVALLKSPMFCFDEDELARLALQAESGNLYEKIERALTHQGQHPHLVTQSLRDKLEQFVACLVDWRSFSKRHSIHDTIWKIFNEKLYYDYVGALPNGEKRQANLYALALRANQFEQTGFKGLNRFIAMIDKLLTSKKDLASVEVALPQNAVQLMTVHKSKGLEFEYVFLLNLDKKFNQKDTSGTAILSRENGIGIKYVADMREAFDASLPPVRVQMNTLPYQLNQKELKRATLSEQMRLLYVALTRAEKKVYLVGKGSQGKLADKYDGKSAGGVLLASSRENMTSFQDWILAIEAAFQKDDLHFKKRFVTDEELTDEQIGKLLPVTQIKKGSLSNLRQSEDIRQALTQLKGVDRLNQLYAPAIHLPSVRTPSQIKKFYQSILADEEVTVMEKRVPQVSLQLPDFSQKKQVTGSEIGSALHELMQKLPLSSPITKETVAETLVLVDADPDVRKAIDIQKIVDFFGTSLGQEILDNTDKLRREVPFASLQTDPVSKEQFVLRGIVDGFLRYPERIVLFDYKTDKYTDPAQLVSRYHLQMQLYADSLRQAYGIDTIQTYLILLGGKSIEVVAV